MIFGISFVYPKNRLLVELLIIGLWYKGGEIDLSAFNSNVFQTLFLSQENLYRATHEIELAAKLVLKEPLVWIAYILWKITEERE